MPSPPLLPGPQNTATRGMGSVFLASTTARICSICRRSSSDSSPLPVTKVTAVKLEAMGPSPLRRWGMGASSITAAATAWAAFSISSREGTPRSWMAMRSSSRIWAVVAAMNMENPPFGQVRMRRASR